uniref:Uncharacterized protein n=1 Tax=Avena sativa TaxID=4498 RepID=A0ACD5ZPD4_AVESA
MDGEIIVHVESLARTLMEKQEGMPPEEQYQATTSIHRLSRVPMHLRDNNSKDYTPGFVAIGPFHKDVRLRAAEPLKVTYLKSLVSRGHPDRAQHLAVIEDYVRVVAAHEKEARAMYVGEEVAGITSDDFIQMMVLDGCFIIEHLVNVAMGREEPSLHATPFGPSQLSIDLILAENQMPFFILVDLIACTKLPVFDSCGHTPSVLLVKLVLFYLAGEKGRDMSEALPDADGVDHILHLLHAMITTARTCWRPPPRVLQGGWAQEAMRLLPRLPYLFWVALLRLILPEGARRRRAGDDYVPSASDMKRMGVQLKKARAGPGMPVVGIASVTGPVPLAVKAVTVNENNKLQLPQLRLEFGTAPLLLNLMAFEQSSRVVAHDVSAYVAFMAKLVRSAEDARVLVEADVVQQLRNESMEDVASFFRVLGAASGSEATHMLFRSYLTMTLELLREWSSGWVDVERNYFTFLAELLALVTFVSSVATILQTYAAFKYH